MVVVVLELEQVVGGIYQDKGAVHFDESVESLSEIRLERTVSGLGQGVERVEVGTVAKRHAKVTWVHLEFGNGGQTLRRGAEVTHDLIAKEIQRHAVVVATGKLAAQLRDVKVDSGVDVVGRNGEVENVT